MKNIYKFGGFFDVPHTEDYELIGTIKYKNCSYPAKLTYNLTKNIEVIIYDTEKNRILLKDAYNKGEALNEWKVVKELESKIVFYTSIYGNTTRITFYGLQVNGGFSSQITAVCEYCLIYNCNEAIDFNKECDASFSLANIDNFFWNGLGNLDLEKSNLDLYDKCKISIQCETSFSWVMESNFYYHLKPKTIEKQAFYKENEEKINEGFKSMFEKFIQEFSIDKKDIMPNAEIKKVFFNISNTKNAIEDVKSVLALFEIITHQSICCDTLFLKQGETKVNVLYSFQIKKILENPIGIHGFSFSRCLYGNDKLFENWFKLYSDIKIKEITKFIFMIIYENRYYPDFILMQAIAALECIGGISDPNITSNDGRPYIKQGLSFSLDEIIDKLYTLLRKGQGVLRDGKISAIAEDVGGYIRNVKAHGYKHIKDEQNITKVNDLVQNGLTELLIQSVKCYIYKKINLKDDDIKIILRRY
jgi:hypothetical protein